MAETVLIVDDSKLSRKNNAKILTQMGYEVVGEACDGVDGIAKTSELSPDLIVTDLEMPNLDGLGMIAEIRKTNQDVKIVVVTSIVSATVIKEAVKQKASLVKKPIKEDKLNHALEFLEQ